MVEDEIDELAASIGLLWECPALRSVKVVLNGGYSMFKRAKRATTTDFNVFEP